MFDRALERPERLRPLAVLAAVPEQERRSRRRRDRHRAPGVVPTPRPSAMSVLEVALRLVAGAARDLAVRAQPRVEEEPLARARGRAGRRRRGWSDRPAAARARSVDSERSSSSSPRTIRRASKAAPAAADHRSTSSATRGKRCVQHRAAPAHQRSRLNVTVSAPRSVVDGDRELPPAAHVEAHAFDLVARRRRAFCVTRGRVGSPCPCCGMPPSIVNVASSIGAAGAVDDRQAHASASAADGAGARAPASRSSRPCADVTGTETELGDGGAFRVRYRGSSS